MSSWTDETTDTTYIWDGDKIFSDTKMKIDGPDGETEIFFGGLLAQTGGGIITVFTDAGIFPDAIGDDNDAPVSK